MWIGSLKKGNLFPLFFMSFIPFHRNKTRLQNTYRTLSCLMLKPLKNVIEKSKGNMNPYCISRRINKWVTYSTIKHRCNRLVSCTQKKKHRLNFCVTNKKYKMVGVFFLFGCWCTHNLLNYVWQ